MYSHADRQHPGDIENTAYPLKHIPEHEHLNVAGYLPPNQYVPARDATTYDQSGVNALMAIRDLEYRLEHGKFRWYRYWINLLMVCAVFNFISAIVCAIIEWHGSGFFTQAIISGWMICQCKLERDAIKEKDVSKAYRALALMCGYSVINVISIALTASLYFTDYKHNSAVYGAIYLFVLLWVYFIFLCVHFGITVFGAAKVHKILSERHYLQKKLEAYGNQYAI
jgi:hypothetical protein